MTNQDVINFLNHVRKILLDDKSWLESTIQPINEAFDKAISALQAQDVPDTNVGDMISRQAAIDAVSRGCYELRGVFAECEKNLNELPSVQSEPSQVARDIATIIENEQDMRVMLSQPEIVRCKDCRYDHDCNIQYHAQAGDEFYCGAAERRTDEGD